MSWKLSLTAAAVAILAAGSASAAVVITGWSTGNVDVSTATNGVPGQSVIYDRAPTASGAVTSGRLVFDGTESDTPGLRVESDSLPGDPPSGGDVSNCVMANSATSCNGAKQTGKRFKFVRTGHGATDMAFNLNPDGTFGLIDNDGLYKFFQAFGNDTGGRLGSFAVSLGTGVGDAFVASTAGDGLSFKQSFGGKPPNNSQFSALFANGLFGDVDDVHTITGYFSTERAGFGLTFGSEDSFQSSGLFGPYARLFGPMLSYDQLPLGYFFDDDGNAETDNVLIAHQLADGTWMQNRAIDASGNVTTIASGNGGTAFDSEDDLVAYLKSITPFEDCGLAGTACLAGSATIDDLAKFNLSFFVDPSGFAGEQFTLRFESTVPEPGSLVLVALALGAAGFSVRRRNGG